jgi:hypothetical protein
MDSTELIALWHKRKEILKEKDFRDDPWRLAYNAFMMGFSAGYCDHKKELIKDAVEGEVVKDMHGFFHIKSVPIDGAKYKFGNRYKIIILKDDENTI